ncbi:hypothetical protein ACHAXA_004664 [Cyclostephanos tholiformis]|uniref:Uncharacterized protein n=1 Tax=Cyclostephanos tholiformis TaxID=382380 RepID=A0ABD3R855_9STRA
MILHSPRNFGGTRTRPENKLVCMLGLGPQAVSVVVDLESALRDCIIIVPTVDELSSCMTAQDVDNIQTPTEGIPGFEGNPANHADDINAWLYGVHCGSIPETRYSVSPDDDKIFKHNALRHASCISRTTPILPASCTRFLNQDNVGMAQYDLVYQFKELNAPDVTFPTGTTNALYLGQFLYSDSSKPSNFTIFAFREQEPNTDTHQEDFLDCHLLREEGQRKSVNDIKASLKQPVHVPSDINSLGIQVQLFQKAASIFFAEYSRKDVNDKCLEFDDVIDAVLNGTFNISLPPAFSKMNSSDESDDHRKNPDLKLIAGENWKEDFANILPYDRPAWTDKIRIAQVDVPACNYLNDDVPFATARELIVDIPVDPRGYADVYIDDTTGLTVDLPGTLNVDRLKAAIPLAIEVTATLASSSRGYSDQGFAWRWQIPDDLKFRATNNLLEFLAAIITPWIDIISGRLNRGDCALSMTDSTTAKGWMRKSNFTEAGDDPIQASTRVDAARKYAELFLTADVKGYSQWFAGKSNNVTDALSRDEISSWLISLLRQLPVKEQLREEHMTAKLDPGGDGRNTANLSDAATSSWTGSTDMIESSCLEHLLWLSGRDVSHVHGNATRHWLKAHVAITFEMQKNDQKDDTVIHGRTDDKVLCPVLQLARLVNRVWGYLGTTEDTPICTYKSGSGRLNTIVSSQVLSRLCAAASAIGSARLGFEPNEIGTHSLWSGAAMEMYLAGVPVYTIMLIGRWSSDAFLRYIRKQVEQFSRHNNLISTIASVVAMIDDDATSSNSTLIYSSALILALISWIIWKFVLSPLSPPASTGSSSSSSSSSNPAGATRQHSSASSANRTTTTTASSSTSSSEEYAEGGGGGNDGVGVVESSFGLVRFPPHLHVVAHGGGRSVVGSDVLLHGVVPFRSTPASSHESSMSHSSMSSSSSSATMGVDAMAINRRERARIFARMFSSAGTGIGGTSSSSSSPPSSTNPRPPPNRGANVVITIRHTDVRCVRLQKALYLLGTYYNLFVIVDGSSSSSSSSLISDDDVEMRKIVKRIRSELLNESNDDDVVGRTTTNGDDSAIGLGGYVLNSRVLPHHRIAFSSTPRGRVAFVRQLHGTELVVDHDEEGVTRELERFGFRVLVYPNVVGDDGNEYSALGKFLIP